MAHEICDYYVQSIIMNLKVKLGKLWLHNVRERWILWEECV